MSAFGKRKLRRERLEVGRLPERSGDRAFKEQQRHRAASRRPSASEIRLGLQPPILHNPR